MGKRKSRKNKSAGQSTARKPMGKPLAFTSIGLILLAFLYVYLNPPGRVTSANPAPAKGSLIENRPVLSSALFSGKQKLAYQYASEIPKVIDSLFCYCYCKKNHGHKTLLTCFTSMHGSKCDVCMDEVIYAHELYEDGESLDAIVAAVDKKFYRPYRSHR